MNVQTIKVIILFFAMLLFSDSCKKNNQYEGIDKLRSSRKYQKLQTSFKNIKNIKGEIIQTDTCNFTVIFKDTTKLKYNNVNFKRSAYKDYQFKIVLKDVLEKPLNIKTTNYYGYLQFDWILKKDSEEYVLQMFSDTSDYVIDEFRLRKRGKYYSLYKVNNIIPLRNDLIFSKQVCTLLSENLKKDTIDCTINNFINCISIK